MSKGVAQNVGNLKMYFQNNVLSYKCRKLYRLNVLIFWHAFRFIKRIYITLFLFFFSLVYIYINLNLKKNMV